ncbi:MAG: hypothetical protein ACE367_05535 [Acidimicrobiales bacterium]
MGRKFSGTYMTNRHAAEVWEVLPDVLADCGFAIEESSDADLTLRAKKSMKNATIKSAGRRSARATWGEKLEASVTADGDHTRVELESRLVFGLVDWGENRKNVEAIRSGLDAVLRPRS